MSRAALLPTPGDPFILAAWLRHYQLMWKDEVDTLYVHLNSRLESPVMRYSMTLVQQAHAECLYTRAWMGHGEALKPMYEQAKETHLVLVEDDTYVRFPGVMRSCFEKVERNEVDAVVNCRGSIGMQILEQEQQVFKLTGDLFWKPNFWPAFFFCHRDIFAGTDYNFGCKNWYPGDVIKELNNFTVTENQSGDTFSWMSIQLRAKNLRFFTLEDGRATTQDWFLYDQKQGIFANPPIAPWLHFGSTSSGISNSLLDENFKPLENRTQDHKMTLPTIPDDHIRDDYARRISLWKLCWQHFPIPEGHEAAYFNKVYGDAIDRLVDGCDISRARLNRYMDIYRNTLPWLFK